jgi:DNA-binding response OmpR family regulator
VEHAVGESIGALMSSTQRPLRVVVVEDEPTVREFLVDALTEAGFDVTGVDLAQRALGMLRQNPPDAVILDLGMPPGTMQGMELLAELREDPASHDIPVIILSAFGDVINRDVTTRLGVRTILSKPLPDIEQLFAALHGIRR